MISLFALWMPILLSAVAVFVVSSIIHMVLKYHNSDYSKVPDEDDFLEAVGRFNLAPGDYFVPRAETMKEMGSPEYIEKCNKGPVAFFTVMKPGPPSMGPQLLQWFVYSIVVGVFVAYITRLTLPAGAEYMTVSRVAGAVAFCCYGLALAQGSIWYKRQWVSTLKSLFDALLYGLFTGGIFGWLWPGI
jgi:hypothetical protein